MSLLQEYEAERNGVIEVLIAHGIDVNGLTDESALLKMDGESSSVLEGSIACIYSISFIHYLILYPCLIE